MTKKTVGPGHAILGTMTRSETEILETPMTKTRSEAKILAISMTNVVLTVTLVPGIALP